MTLTMSRFVATRQDVVSFSVTCVATFRFNIVVDLKIVVPRLRSVWLHEAAVAIIHTTTLQFHVKVAVSANGNKHAYYIPLFSNGIL